MKRHSYSNFRGFWPKATPWEAHDPSGIVSHHQRSVGLGFYMPERHSTDEGHLNAIFPSGRAGKRGFSLLELVVVIAILGVLMSTMIPALGSLSHRSQVVLDLSNLRSIQMAHYQFAIDSKGQFADAGLSHGGLENEEIAWLTMVGRYIDIDQFVRSPLDNSQHWTVPIEGTTDRFRRTSYGWNNYMSRTHSPDAAIDPLDVADRLSRVKHPSKTVHFLHMASAGAYAGADHVHVENWWIGDSHPDAPAVLASNQVETHVVTGEKGTKTARANYGFVDGHVQTLSFGELYARPESNQFDPKVAGFGF